MAEETFDVVAEWNDVILIVSTIVLTCTNYGEFTDVEVYQFILFTPVFE